jgi:hypothetical protein
MRSIPREGRDVDEELSATVRGSNEPEAAIGIPRPKNAIHLHEWGLTFDMSGGPKGAKQALERPLDGGVGRHYKAVLSKI